MEYKLLPNIAKPSDIKYFSKHKLARLTAELRAYIVEVVALRGGHLASNLGVVELTVALHLAFDSPTDQIVFDVSHQAYVHKLLTGRFESFKSLRQHKGISGFVKRSESPHDIFNAGHASTSLSAALGLAKARDIKGQDHHVVAVIGDGALSGGMAYEALNNIGNDHSKLIIVLNDNEMSIDKNVGSINKYLSRIRTNPGYYKAKADVHSIIDKIPTIGKPIANSISRVKESIKQLVVPGMLFEEMGLTYIGVVDGHDIEALRNTFESIKNVDGPVLIHVLTKKGKGVAYAERDPEKFHGTSPYNATDGTALKASTATTYSQVFGKKICDLAAADDKICAITAAMPSGTGLKQFAGTYPDRFFDVGIAEAHAVTFAAGLAVNGMKPFFAVYSTFLQRAYDQLIHDVCIQNLAVVFCIDRAGLVGNDGETHHGVFDLSYLLPMPNMMVLSPKDGDDLNAMLNYATTVKQPLAIRYSRGACQLKDVAVADFMTPDVISYGDRFNLIAIGSMHSVARAALERLNEAGIAGRLITIKCLKPLDRSILQHLNGAAPIFSLEDNSLIGGFGSYFRQCLDNWQVSLELISFGIEDQFVGHGAVDELLQELRLDAASTSARIAEHLAAQK